MYRTEVIKYCFLLPVFLLFSLTGFSQNAYYFEIVFKEKGSAFSTSNPSAFLSEQSIEKKSKKKIAIDVLDFPLDEQNLQSLSNYRDSITHRSKWRNSVLIKITDTSAINGLKALGSVQSVTYFTAKKITSNKKQEGSGKFNTEIDLLPYTYGAAANQLEMLGGHFLHERGYNGEGMDIAVFDAGFNPDFYSVKLSINDQLSASGQIKYTWDFIDHDSLVFEKNPHGAMVLSVMGIDNKKIIGSAPKANYYLFITEDDNSETLLEEYNWLMAAEKADSIGVDIINSSLGYYEFNDTLTNHHYKDMDGKTTLVAKAANTAAHKGIFVVSSAGNEAQTQWQRIISPADADSALAVGAVNGNRKYAFFSSLGPAADGDVKPNVTAQGQGTAITFYNNMYVRANGTSFSGPLMAGAAACLWQAFPELTNMELKKAIEESAHLYLQPDSLMGYGIPDLLKIYMNRGSTDQFKYNESMLLSLRSNPFKDRIGVELYSAQKKDFTLQLLDVSGRLIREEKHSIEENQYIIFGFGDLEILAPGLYFFSVADENGAKVWKVVKD
ncbi:MAG: S8 family serine peptidase [Flavobacteriales bacterium]